MPVRALFAAMLLSAPLSVSTAGCQQIARAARFLGGGAIGLVTHEASHVAFDLGFHATVELKGVSFGPLPFFAIMHNHVSPLREFTIASAGFWEQHVSNEIILARHPRLRTEQAPALKGVFAFNVVTSVLYAGAAFARTGPAERDTRSIAHYGRISEPAVGVMLLVPAMLDGARYFGAEQGWVRWTSRTAKVGELALLVRAARY